MRKMCQRLSLVAVLVGVLGTFPFQSVSAATVATVISTSGEGYVEGPQGRRDLECGTPIREGERVITPAGARVGIVADDVYVQLDSSSDVAIERSASGAPIVALAAGRARVLDTRESGDAVEIRGPGASGKGLGTDTVVAVRGDSTEYCEDSESGFAVQALTANRGECVSLRAGGAPEKSTKVAAELPLASPAACIDVAVVDHFTPGVAAPALSIGLAPIDPERPIVIPCSEAGCGRTPMFPPSGGERIIIEQEPVPIPGPGPMPMVPTIPNEG